MIAGCFLRPGLTERLQAQMNMHDAVRCSPLFEIRETQSKSVLNHADNLIAEKAAAWMGLPPGLQPSRQPNPSGGSDTNTYPSSNSPDVSMSRQDNSFSSNLGIPSDGSRSTSGHPTPSTASHRGSTTTSSSSPAFCNTGVPSSSTGDNASLFPGSNDPLSYGTSGFGAYKEQQQNLQFNMNPVWEGTTGTGFTPKDTSEPSWIVDLDTPQLVQQMDETNWAEWSTTTGRP